MAATPRETADASCIAGWVSGAASGDRWAWEQLIGHYGRLIWAITQEFRLAESDAGDVAQVTWLRLLEHIGRLEHPERVGSWLASTARHECLRLLAARRRVILSPDTEALDGIVDPEPAAEEAVIAAERARAVREAVARLPQRHQQLLSMLMTDPPVPYAEISATLGVPVGSIGPARARYLARLQAILLGTQRTKRLGAQAAALIGSCGHARLPKRPGGEVRGEKQCRAATGRSGRS